MRICKNAKRARRDTSFAPTSLPVCHLRITLKELFHNARAPFDIVSALLAFLHWAPRESANATQVPRGGLPLLHLLSRTDAT